MKVKHECFRRWRALPPCRRCGRRIWYYARGYVCDTTGSYNGVKLAEIFADSPRAGAYSRGFEAARNADYTIFSSAELNKSANQDSEGHDRLRSTCPTVRIV